MGPVQLGQQRTTRSGRCTFHDLLRAYAASLASSPEPDAVRRVLTYYLRRAEAADRRLTPLRGLLAAGPPTISFADRGQALAWFGAERDLLVAAVRWAADTGFPRHAWRLARCLTGILGRIGKWHELLSVQLIAMSCAPRTADTCGQIHAHRALAHGYGQVGRNHEAEAHLWHALYLGGWVGDHAGVAQTLMTLARTFGEEGPQRGRAPARPAGPSAVPGDR